MDRSSPRILCHFRMLILFWDRGMEDRISASLSTRCCGREIVWSTVLIIQPSTSFMVDHEQSPLRSFFIETGSRRDGLSEGDKGRKTSSMADMRVLRTLFLCFLPCASPMKSSTKTSMYPSFSFECGRYGSRNKSTVGE